MSEISDPEIVSDITKLDHLIREATPEQGLTFCVDFIGNHPERGEGFFYAGLLCYRLGQLGQAMEMMTKAHELDPEGREFALALSSLYAKSNRLNDALYFAKVGAANEPNIILNEALPEELRDFIASTLNADPQKHYVRALLAYNLRHFDEVVRECEQELKSNNRFAPGYALIGKALLKLGHIERALRAFLAVFELAQGEAVGDVRTDLAECYLRLGQPQDALATLEPLFHRTDLTVAEVSAIAKLLAYVPDNAWADVRIFCNSEIDRTLGGAERYFPTKAPVDERIRVGFLTDKAYQCLEGRALEVFSKRYDRNVFECFMYFQNIVHDSVTHGFAGTMSGTRNVYDIDDKTLALIIQRDGIDVLVDMCGYGESQRLNLIAHKPALAHVSWLASPALDDQPGIDRYWRVSNNDSDSAPLRGAPIALETLQGYGAVTPLPAAALGNVTFGARLDLSYITPEIAAMWGDLLSKIDGARLLIGLVEEISPIMVDRLAALLEPVGILDRVTLHTPDHAVEGRGVFYREVDIFLGQPTVDATEDFIDALWCGVPCLSIPPDRQAFYTGRDVVSLLGEASWNAADALGLAQMGVSMAGDISALGAIRAALRDRVTASALLDGNAFTEQLLSKLVEVVIWSRDNQGKA